MKNSHIILITVISSISLFSCRTDELAEDLNDDINIEEVAGRERDVLAEEEL